MCGIQPSTFSIVAWDPDRPEWGVAVASKFLAAGAVVSWARAGAGAVATQSYANTSYGPRALEAMAAGQSARDVLDELIASDPDRAHRQVGLVDRQGRAAAYTGASCLEWAGHLIGEGYTCQGNILVDQRTVESMAEAFESGRGELSDRLVEALAAGQAAGGDRRGRQSAGVLVVRDKGGYGGFNDRYVDLRVDDDPEPVAKLRHLLRLHHVYFGETQPGDWREIVGDTARLIQVILQHAGKYHGEVTGEYDADMRAALAALIGAENLEERFDEKGNRIDVVALEVLRDRYGVKE